MSSETLSIASTQDDNEVQTVEEASMKTPKAVNRRSHRGKSRKGGPPVAYKGVPAGTTTPQVPPSLLGMNLMSSTPFRPGVGLNSNRGNRGNALTSVRRPRVPDSDSFSSPGGITSDQASISPLGASPVFSTPQMKPSSKKLLGSVGRWSAPMCTQRNDDDEVTYPLIYLTPAGSISIFLEANLIVETTVDRSIRVVSHGNYSAYMNYRGSATSIVHPNARVFHQDAKVNSVFSSTNNKTVIFGAAGILFSMEHLRESYLVNAANKDAPTVATAKMATPKLDKEYTLFQFFRESQTGSQFFEMLKEIVDQATYDRRTDGILVMQINGMTIRHSFTGDLFIDARPRHLTCTAQGAIHLRTTAIDTNVQSADMSFIKMGMKRVHVSRSGMVVNDGCVCTSMDNFGHIIAST